MKLSKLAGLQIRLFLLVLLAVVPVLVVVVAGALEHRKLMAGAVQEDALRIARVAARDYEELIEEAERLLRGLENVSAIDGDSADACSAQLATLHTAYPQYSMLGAATAAGDISCSSRPLLGTASLAGEPFFQHVVETHSLAASNFVAGHVSGRPGLLVANPVVVQDELRRVLLAEIDLSWVGRILEQAELPAGSTFLVVDAEGTVLAHAPDSESWVGRSIASASIVQEVLSRRAEGVTQALGMDGVDRLYAFLPLGDDDAPTGAYVVIGVPTAVAFERPDRVLVLSLAGLAVAAGLALLAARFGGHVFLIGPMRDLLGATRRLAAGDLSARSATAGRPDEIGQLARAFDAMAASLEHRESERQRAEQALRESEARLRRESERLLALHRASTILAEQAGDPVAVLTEILRSATELLGGDSATLYRWNPAEGLLRVVRSWNIPAAEQAPDRRPGEGVAGQTFLQGRPVVVDHYPSWELATAAGLASGLQAALGVPLRHGGRPIGVLLIR